MLHRNGIYSEYRDPADASEASRQLEREGYTLVRNLFTPDEVVDLAADVDQVFVNYDPDGRDGRRSPEEDDHFRYEMLNRSEVCRQAIAKRALLEVIEPLLGEDCHVIANTAWRNPANFDAEHGGGSWHIDAGPHIPLAEGMRWPEDIPHPVFAIGVHIYLKDCRMEDGPTGVIPGSHLSGQFPPPDQIMNDELTFEGQGVVPLLANAGDVGFFVSDVWHRRMPTRKGDQGRYFLQAHYGRRDIAQRIRTTAATNHLSDETISQVTDRRLRQLMGLHEPFFYDG